MTDQVGPRNDVLAERIEALTRLIQALEHRIGSLATESSIQQLIESRDRLYNQRINDLTDDIKQLTAALATERAERQAADRENEERANRARTFAVSAIGLAVSVLLGIVALISQIGGAP